MRPKFGSMLLAGAVTLAVLAAQSAAAQKSSASAFHATTAAAGSLNVAVTYNGTLTDLINTSRFWMQGGSVQVEGRFYGGWGAVADISGMHIANVNATGVGLDLVTATFGPRYTWSPAHSRYAIFGQGLLGVANGFNSYFPNVLGVQTVASSLAVKAGGGLNYQLRRHLALRLFEADYLRTQLPNSTNNAQNSLQLGAGVVLRFR